MCLMHGYVTWCYGLVDMLAFSLKVGFCGPGDLFHPQWFYDVWKSVVCVCVYMYTQDIWVCFDFRSIMKLITSQK